MLGIPCLGLNGGPAFKHTEACSFQIATDTQEETDRYWNAIVDSAFEAMMPMQKIDIATIEAARRGEAESVCSRQS